MGDLAKVGDAQTDAVRRLGEVSIPGDEDDFLVTEFERGRKMDRVVTAQLQFFGVLAGVPGEVVVAADRDQLRAQTLDYRKSLPVLILGKSIEAARSPKRRPDLGVARMLDAAGWVLPQSSAARSEPSSTTTSLTSAEVSK